jgi:hypothetical protein
MTIQEQISKLEKDLADLKTKCKEEKFKYPLYFQNRKNKMIVKFSGLHTGTVVIMDKYSEVASRSTEWTPHTNKYVWEQVAQEDVIPDKALVWCWDDEMSFRRNLKFWDAKNKATFNSFSGKRDVAEYRNYELYTGEEPEWAICARQMLKD